MSASAPEPVATAAAPAVSAESKLAAEFSAMLAALTNSEQVDRIRQEAALLVDAAKSAADADEGRRLQAEGEKLHSLLAAYSESDAGQAALAEARAKIAALHDDRTLELARACHERSRLLVQQVLETAEGQELLARQESIIAQLSALKENEDAQAIVEVLRQRSSSMMCGAIDTQSWARALQSVDTHNLTAERVASEADKLVGKLQQNEHVQLWLQRNQALLGGNSLSSAQTNELLLKSQAFLSDTLSPELVSSALRQGLELHTQYADALAPDALAKNARTLLTDRAARDAFVRQVKDAALAFLLQYLPTIKVQPIDHDGESLRMKLANLDLSGFKVPSERVDVQLEQLLKDGILLRADTITCHMPSVRFSFEQKSFPYVSGEGVANIHASSIAFALTLKIEYGGGGGGDGDDENDTSTAAPRTTDVDGEHVLVEPVRSVGKVKSTDCAPVVSAAVAAATTTAQAAAPAAPSKQWIDDDASTTCLLCAKKFSFTRRKHHCRKCGTLCCDDCSKARLVLPSSGSTDKERHCDTCAAAARRATQLDAAATTAAAQSAAIAAPTHKSSASAQPPVRPAADTVDAAGSSSSSPPPPPLPTDAETLEWRKLGRPRLVIAARALTIGTLDLVLEMENSWLSWAYNAVIAWANTMVKERIEAELLDALDARTGLLLAQVNALSRQYWPVLLSLAAADDVGEATSAVASTSASASATGEPEAQT